MEREGARTAGRLDDGELTAVALRHERGLLAYVERLTGDHHLAEDIVQETLVRAWRKAPPSRSRDRDLRGWLFRVARNLAIDLHRSHRARPSEVSLAAAANVPGAARAERSLQVAELVDALRGLREEHRAAIVQTYFLGRSVDEAAAELGVSAGTIKSRCYYGLRALRRDLERRDLLT